MTLFQVLKTLGYEVYENIYQGEEENLNKPFILWNIERDTVTDSYYDNPTYNVRSFQVHFYCPVEDFDYSSVLKSLRETLFSNGYSYPTIDNIMVDNVTENSSANYQKNLVRHITLTTSIKYNNKEVI